MFQAPVVIVSWRDPRDAYASKVAAFPDTSLQFSGWKDQLMERIKNYLIGKKEVAGYAGAWIDLWFEEFAQSEQLRQQLLTSLNLHGQSMRSTFDPSVSAKNIGILRPSPGKERQAWSALAGAVEKAKMEAQAIAT
jgi:hypothetical protein